MKNVILVLAAVVTLSSGFGAEFFVAPNGSDSNPGTASKPFASFARAQTAVRAERKTHPDQGVTVTFQKGTYPLSATLEFTADDSGASPTEPVKYRAKPGARVVISGGQRITGWQPDPLHPGVWKTRVSEFRTDDGSPDRFEELWVDGERAIRARTPNYWEFGILESVTEEKGTEGKADQPHRFVTRPETLKTLEGADAAAVKDMQVVVLHKWDTTREFVESITPAQDVFTTRGYKMQSWNTMGRDSLFYVENTLAALDSPGEWFLSREGTLFYYPRKDEDMMKAEVIAPRLQRFIRMRGEAENHDKWVRHITFEGLQFQHGAFATPAEGLRPWQAAMNCDLTAVQVDAAQNIQFVRCAVEHIGGTAFWFQHACWDCRVEQTRIFDLGVGGVRIGEEKIVPDAVRTKGITIDNCIIQSGGRVMPHTVAVWIGHSSDNAITHCDIGDFFYTAVSVGWRWGYDESAAKRNKIEYNHLHHLGYRILSDMGGVYTLGPSEGTTVRNNVIHDVYSTRYGGWGLYPDEGSTGILFENNLVYDVRDGCVHQHYGKENTFRNNVLAFSEEGQVAITRAEPHLSFTFEHNLVYWDDGYLLGYAGWKNGAKVNLRENLYWRAGGKPFDFAGQSWEQWRAAGNDSGSVIADPLFVNVEKRDFRLKPGSPAEKIGFQPIDFSQAGVYGDKAWKKLAASRTYPKPYVVPQSKPVAIKDDFEQGTVTPLLGLATLSIQGHTDLIAVTDTQAATGRRSLKIQDASDLKAPWDPHFYLDPHYTQGTAHMAFKIRLEAGAIASCDMRSAGANYHTGPTLQFHDGAVFSRGKKLVEFPVKTWLAVDLRAPLGKSDGHWQLTLTPASGDKKQFSDLSCDSAWKEVRWVGFSSNATKSVAFYLDDFTLENL